MYVCLGEVEMQFFNFELSVRTKIKNKEDVARKIEIIQLHLLQVQTEKEDKRYSPLTNHKYMQVFYTGHCKYLKCLDKNSLHMHCMLVRLNAVY